MSCRKKYISIRLELVFSQEKSLLFMKPYVLEEPSAHRFWPVHLSAEIKPSRGHPPLFGFNLSGIRVSDAPKSIVNRDVCVIVHEEFTNRHGHFIAWWAALVCFAAVSWAFQIPKLMWPYEDLFSSTKTSIQIVSRKQSKKMFLSNVFSVSTFRQFLELTTSYNTHLILYLFRKIYLFMQNR